MSGLNWRRPEKRFFFSVFQFEVGWLLKDVAEQNIDTRTVWKMIGNVYSLLVCYKISLTSDSQIEQK